MRHGSKSPSRSKRPCSLTLVLMLLVLPMTTPCFFLLSTNSVSATSPEYTCTGILPSLQASELEATRGADEISVWIETIEYHAYFAPPETVYIGPEPRELSYFQHHMIGVRGGAIRETEMYITNVTDMPLMNPEGEYLLNPHPTSSGPDWFYWDLGTLSEDMPSEHIHENIPWYSTFWIDPDRTYVESLGFSSRKIIAPKTIPAGVDSIVQTATLVVEPKLRNRGLGAGFTYMGGLVEAELLTYNHPEFIYGEFLDQPGNVYWCVPGEWAFMPPLEEEVYIFQAEFKLTRKPGVTGTIEVIPWARTDSSVATGQHVVNTNEVTHGVEIGSVTITTKDNVSNWSICTISSKTVFWAPSQKEVSAERALTDLTVSPPNFSLAIENSIEFSATLTSAGLPLPDKSITWFTDAGTLSPTSGTTDSDGRVTVTYTAPTVAAQTSVTVTASFAGDDNYQSSSGTSSGTIEAPSLQADVEIKPNTLQIGSAGRWVTCYIELPDDDVSQIDVSSIRLQGTIQVDPAASTEIGDYDGDGVPDLMVKFDRSSVENIVSPGVASLVVTGNIDGSAFAGTDVIDVIAPPREPIASANAREKFERSPFSWRVVERVEESENEIVVEVSSGIPEGTTIFIDIDNTAFVIPSSEELRILVDNENIELADDYDDVLAIDENVPEYLVSLKENRIRVKENVTVHLFG